MLKDEETKRLAEQGKRIKQKHENGRENLRIKKDMFICVKRLIAKAQ